MNVSVIICSFNGSKTIEQTLDSIKNQDNTLSVEIIFVNNNSTDNTEELAIKWKEENKTSNILLFNEPNPGKVHALTKAILISRGEIIVICDDDNFLKPDYLGKAYQLLSNNKQIGLACGINRAIASIPLPDWFKENELLFGCGQVAVSSGDVTHRGAIWGAGMVCQGELLRNIYKSGLEHFASGAFSRNGFRIGGEDNELCFWIIQLGYRLWFSTDLVLDHFMFEERLNTEYLKKLEAGIISGNFMLKKNIGIIKKALRPIWKRDFLNLFLINDNGKIARIKFGLTSKNDKHYKYVQNLKRLKNMLS
jgi:glycosyltransferase involved in cell wall biosynthesis